MYAIADVRDCFISIIMCMTSELSDNYHAMLITMGFFLFLFSIMEVER